MKIPRLSRRRGFTLTELMVSLVMGLIVALAAVGLARSATTTFHEQARSSTAEMSLRVASDRLRQDLMRASYMSTGNILVDPKVAKLVGAAAATDIARYPSLERLRGVSIDVGMVKLLASTPPPTFPDSLAANGLTPDAIELTGNFTTDDAYTGTIVTGALGSSGTGNCVNPQTIILDPTGDAATYNLGGGDGGPRLATNGLAAFMPKEGRKFIAQVTDPIGCNHYVPVCDVALLDTKLLVMVDGSTSMRGVLYSNASDQGPVDRSCGASEGGRVTIAPVSRVRWHLQQPLATSQIAATDGDGKIDLVRDVLDFDGAIAFTEVVSEYVVDLKFGIVVDVPTAAGTARQRVIDLDSASTDIDAITNANSLVTNQLGPQRVRSIQYRIAARTSVPDREQDLPLGAGPIRARYCVEDNLASCKKWARVRTVTSEVALINQAGMFY